VTISKSIFVKRPVAAAFRLFTAEIGTWWPLKEGLSFGGERAHQIFMEARVGGRFFERFTDGEEFECGKVTVYEPPARVAFTWRQPDWDGPTEVDVRFVPERDGTRVLLEHRGWERLAEASRSSRDSYDGGWDFALSRYAA
jgi:uncharacterized protein YndB with AHSA1/START domain